MRTQSPRALAAYTQTDDDAPGDVSPLSEISEDRYATADLTPARYETRIPGPEFERDQRPIDELPPVIPDRRPYTAGSSIGPATDTQIVGQNSRPAQEPHQTSHVEEDDSRMSRAVVDEDSLGPQMEKSRTPSTIFELVDSYWSRCGPWRWDVLALIFACALLVTDIAILARYNGSSLTDWHANISINTIISTISTVAMFTLMNPLGAAVGQCKWLLFRQQKRPLSHLSHLDGASRGPYGSIKLFGRRKKYGALPAVGALLMIVSIAVNPFMQQLIRYRFRDLEQGFAYLPVAYDYGSTGVGGFFAANLTMKAAAYAGFFSPLNSTFNVTSYCPSGNCTWPPFQSLGVCSSCEDLTNQIERIPIAPEYFNGG